MKSLVPIVRNAGEGDKQTFFGGGLHTWKLLAEDTGGAFFLFEDTMLKDKTTPLHLHPEAHEVTYVIDGEIEVQVDGNRSRVRSGGMSFVPKGVAHAFIVVSAEARLITLQSPGRSARRSTGAPAPRPSTTPSTLSTSPGSRPRRPRIPAASNSSAPRRSRRSVDDVVLEGPECGRRPVRHADLRVDVLDVVISRLRGDIETVGDLARREPFGDKAQHLDLATTEITGRDGAGRPRR